MNILLLVWQELRMASMVKLLLVFESAPPFLSSCCFVPVSEGVATGGSSAFLSDILGDGEKGRCSPEEDS